ISHDVQWLVARQDVLIALNEVQLQPQVGETIHDLSSQGLKTVEGKPTVFETDVTPQMTNQIGTLSYGVLTTLISESSTRMLQHYKKGNMVVESLNIYVIEQVQMDSNLIIKQDLLDAGSIYANMKVSLYINKELVSKGM